MQPNKRSGLCRITVELMKNGYKLPFWIRNISVSVSVSVSGSVNKP